MARALARATGRVWEVSQDGLSLVTALNLPAPEKVVEFIDRFDLNQPVQPFSFALELPE